MMRGRWFAVGSATLILSIGYWFGYLSFGSSRGIALGMMAVALVFSVYSIAGFSGASPAADIAFRASLEALAVALALLFAYQVTGVDALAVASPVVAAGVGGAGALAPTGDRMRRWIRIGVVIAVATALTWIYEVDHTVYGLVAPILPYPTLALADKLYDRGQEIVAETAPD